MKPKKWWIFFLAFPLWGEAEGETAESPSEAGSSFLKADAEGAIRFNFSLRQWKDLLKEKFLAAEQLMNSGAPEGEFAPLLAEVRNIRTKISQLEEQWRRTAANEVAGGEEPYALWDMGETTVAQLVMEYGAADSLYIIPPELSSMKISLFTNLPLPRETWSDLIEAILIHNGVGVKKINANVKQLYILKLDPSAIEAVVDREEKLSLFVNHARLFFVLTPPPEQIKAVQAFFERFSDPKQTTVQAMGSKVILVSSKETIEKLLGLYHTVWESNTGKVVRLISLVKMQATEAEKVLKAVFSDSSTKARPSFYPSGADELIVLTLPQGLVLIGEKETVDRGQHILEDLESQLEDPGEKVIYWYTCKHSNPEDIAAVLEKIYDSLIGSNFDKKAEPPPPPPPVPPVPPQEPNGAQIFPPPSNAYNPILPAQAPFMQPGVIEKKANTNFGNFVVDNKTTSILMVVKREELPKIKSLIKRLDVPKRMVQLDVLLVEKKLHDRRQVGFNLLQIGTNSSGVKESAMTFDNNASAFHRGILSFIYSKPNSSGSPAMDLVYNFLLAQEDIRINANPSVLAINQTPATVSIVEEISINNGAIQLNTQAGVTVEQSYTRAQYGITILLTPTIHLADSENTDELARPGFVSLQTNLEFDTTQMTANDRPPVTRRHVENEVCIPDGETVILGGLRRKIEEDTRDKIPFLGDLPGIGKLFGLTKSVDTNTEMFIFITPHIIHDPVDDLRQIRQTEYQLRAGDVPEFLACIDEAKAKERRKLFGNSMKMLFDMY
ncbi:MAG: type II secretion system protein GspD [Verrucomicrobiota bacterium]|nr:type II secretion system protein GspD [Verrucomicrobiota bacterium]